MATKRVPDGFLIALALPVYQIWHIGKYANTHRGWPAKVATFVVFLPVIAFCTTIWVAFWALAVWLAMRLVN
jgi:hypothetical protein